METQEFEVSKIKDSPFQPRTEHKGIEELAASIDSAGLLQSMVVRLVAGAPELVAGHRRIRALRLNGITHTVCHVVDKTDAEVREAILIENGQREDVPPLEELAIYQALRTDGHEVADIAAKIGRSEAYVYRRLQLSHLCKAGAKALAAGKLSLGVAEIVARIRPKKLQEDAVGALKETEWSGAASVKQAKDWVEQNATLNLANAGFNTADAELVPSAGSCLVCPKNTVGSMLFPDFDRALCTDAACFTKKRNAAWELRKAEAEGEGVGIIEGEDAAKAFYDYGGLRPHMLDLDSQVWTGNSRKKWRDIIGKQRLKEVPIFLLRNRAGTVITVVKRSAVKKAMVANPRKDDPSSMGGTKTKHELEMEFDTKAAKAFHADLLQAMSEALERSPMNLDIGVWRTIAHGIVARAWDATVRTAVSRRKLMPPKEKDKQSPLPHDVLTEFVEGVRPGRTASGEERIATRTDLQFLVLELLLLPEFSYDKWNRTAYTRGLFGVKGAKTTICLFPDLDIPQLEKRARARVKEAREAKAAKKTASKKDPTPKKSKPSNGAAPKDRTQKVMGLLAKGMSKTEIGKELGLSRHQVARIIKKANA